GDKDVISQVDRLSSKDTKIARRSVRIAVNASVRSAATCMVVSRVGGLATSLCRARRSLSRRPWDLSPHTPCRSPGALTRVAARTLAPSPICDLLHRRLQPFRHLHDCSGCFRLERSPGGACTHWKAPPSHGARRVEVWRGDVRLSMSVSAPFVWRCLSGSAVAPFPHPAHRTGQADFPHPALGQDLTPSFACDAICSF